jgi:hypothetical protein
MGISVKAKKPINQGAINRYPFRFLISWWCDIENVGLAARFAATSGLGRATFAAVFILDASLPIAEKNKGAQQLEGSPF